MKVFGALLTLLLLQYNFNSGATYPPTYMVAVTSQAVGATTETLCAHLIEPNTTLSLLVTLSTDSGDLTILKENSIRKAYFKCVKFMVPVVLTDTVATVFVKIEGPKTSFTKKTQILIKPSQKLILIQTDKPIYKPGETVKFRIVSLDPAFLTYNQKFRTIELQDPNFNRINQWLNQTTRSGILDLFHSTSANAMQGTYTINAWDEKNQQTSQSFDLDKYVLPKFEVTTNFPDLVTFVDTEFTLQVCAKYTYGKPVQGSVTLEVCGRSYYYWFRGPLPETPGTCKNYTLTTDRTGCASQVVNVSDIGMSQGGEFVVNYKVEEDGTGITVENTASISFTSDVIRVSFVDSPQIYRPGIAYEGKVLVSDIHSQPMKDQKVYLILQYGETIVNVTLITDRDGLAPFSFQTTGWNNTPVSIQARHEDDQDQYWPAPKYYNKGYLWLSPYYSKSKSFLILNTSPQMLSCTRDANVEANYTIQGSTLKRGQRALDFFYMVYSKGSLVQNGRISLKVEYGKENKGKLAFTIKKTKALSPFAQVLVYAILTNGETVADSYDFPIDQCLPNKVSLSFSSSTALPKQTTTLNLRAQPGSLCSVRSIDQSVLLLKPESELNAAYVFGMLPVQLITDYPYQVYEYDVYNCISNETPDIQPVEPILLDIPREKERRSIGFKPNYYQFKNDAYSAFKGIGVKILTNSDVKEPIYCYYERQPLLNAVDAVPGAVADAEGFAAIAKEAPGSGSPVQNTVRKDFPETWIWDLVPVGRTGSVNLKKALPDTITTWATGAFCTSSVGFGVAPSTNITAFQPFFVSPTLPYSVIRGEELIFKASVFNYLSKCIMVKVTLTNSTQFSALPCNGCIYTQCVCSEESKTFQWTLKASVVGRVDVTVKAETIQTSELCGNEVVTVPEGQRIDTVIQSLLVEAEGIKQTITHSELICLTGNQMNTTVPLNLPEVVVKDSAKSFVTVLGDLMGSALKNIADLLAMPYGCGEQNMINFAPNVYILQYLESTNQLTPEILARAKTYLSTGYQTELTYKHYDGSYSAFGNNDPSGHTWLTAYVMKIFGGSKKYVFIDQANIDQAKNWLGQQQQESGCYNTVGVLYHNDLKGGVSDNATLTAYIVAALLELGVNKSDPMVANGLECLKDASSNLNNTYFNALAAYTFTLAGDQVMRQTLLTNLDAQAKREGAGRYWTQSVSGEITGSLDVETTSYVLLALASGPIIGPTFDLNYAATIVQWLAKKQNAFGGYSSTQDTVVALQALASYSTLTFSPLGTIVVNVTSPTRQKYNFNVNQQNRLVYQEKQLQPPNGTFTLAAKGSGCAFVQFALHYNVPPPTDSASFSITANATAVCNSSPLLALTLDFTVRYNGPREGTNMVNIIVKLLSGYVLDSMSLQDLQQDPTIKRVEQNEGRVIIYLDGIKKSEEKFFHLKLQQDVIVNNLKPAVVTVFDYYKTSEGSMTTYTSPCK
ncbi:alpha-2-macroglobulin-like protein 1 isoform X2 [Paramisgurnus dabryanus]|uniref:alpha-2-macroglobulin-like protein 1 isoform X2 n=1 Tax=Paramisgurnus dabryanus TaxID=90735 RepID=UPI0031F39F98